MHIGIITYTMLLNIICYKYLYYAKENNYIITDKMKIKRLFLTKS